MKEVVTTGAISRAKLQSKCHHQQTNTQLFTGRMPFLSPNQQCQSTEGNLNCHYMHKISCFAFVNCITCVDHCEIQPVSYWNNKLTFLHTYLTCLSLLVSFLTCVYIVLLQSMSRVGSLASVTRVDADGKYWRWRICYNNMGGKVVRIWLLTKEPFLRRI